MADSDKKETPPGEMSLRIQKQPVVPMSEAAVPSSCIGGRKTRPTIPSDATITSGLEEEVPCGWIEHADETSMPSVLASKSKQNRSKLELHYEFFALPTKDW